MPTFNEIQQEIAGMLSIPDEELTPEQREAMDAYMDELAKVEAGKVDGFGQFLKIQAALADACKEEAKRLIAKAKKENTLSIDVEFFPELNLQDDAFSGLAHLVCTALEAINKETERHVG